MNNLEDSSNPEIIEVIADNYPQDEWDNDFGDHCITSFES